MTRLSKVVAIMLTAVGAVYGVHAAAQQSSDGPYVLHEYFEEVTVSLSDTQGGAADPQAPPRAPGEPPALSLETRPGEPVYDRDGPVREPPVDSPYGPLSPYGGANELDDNTDRVDSLTYFASFDPSIIPYKRVVSKDHAVRRDGRYGVEAHPTGRVEVGLQPAPERPSQLFWGTFLLRLEPNRLHPIPSVSPDQAMLQLVTEPSVSVTVLRDTSGNFFVRSPHVGLLRVNMQVAAADFYFGGELPDIPWDAIDAEPVVPEMDVALRAHARGLASRLGFDRRRAPRDTVIEMVRFFRDFEARPLPDTLSDQDRLTAICENSIGVCRHRSLAFVFLAQSIGISARYVYNEAHAFVEVYWPGFGWRRLDLGGAADELNAEANQDRRVHDPGPDGLPEPQRYLAEQQRMQHRGWEPPPSNTARSAAAAAQGQGGSSDVPSDTTSDQNGEPAPADANPGLEPPPFQEPEPDARPIPRLSLSVTSTTALRGDTIDIMATLRDDAGRPLAGRKVEIYLGAVGSTNARAARKIGVGVTRADGQMVRRVEIPREHSIGRWSLFALFPGDTQHQPVVAE